VELAAARRLDVPADSGVAARLRLEVDKLHIAPCIRSIGKRSRFSTGIGRPSTIVVLQTCDGAGDIGMTVDGVARRLLLFS
jgi:hypothetical protein